MKLRLLHTEVLKLTFQKLTQFEDELFDIDQKRTENSYNLNLNVFPDVNRFRIFGVLFSLTVSTQDNLNVALEYVAWFETEDEISEDVINSPFARINAPAVAFPFLRAFVSFLSLNAGYKPIIIPTLNFIELYERSKMTDAQKKEKAGS